MQGGVFVDDVAVLEAQQRQIDRRPARELQSFAIDSSGVRAWLMLDRPARQANDETMSAATG